MQHSKINIPAPVVALAAGGSMKLYAFVAQVPIDASPLLVDVATFLAQLSAVIFLLALVSFGLAKTTINPLSPSRASTLVTGGIYRLTRNPMCLSLLLLLIAHAVRLGAWGGWLGPALFAIFITRYQIIPEERVLADKFGAAFHAYRNRTRRWI
jgi:protein-S-isoprenylcysteine O-methyltransferase Ste14